MHPRVSIERSRDLMSSDEGRAASNSQPQIGLTALIGSTIRALS